MTLNSVKHMTNKMQTGKTNGFELPTHIGLRTTHTDLAPLLTKWKQLNPKRDWKDLLEAALRGDSPLVALAGKRHAHLVNGKAVAA